ncbi:MAG: acyltransferase family protein, partial [Anaerolineaceae bacterium]|nr:acyltransferase family protein [Anaerolineaceae bacterium]
NKVKITYVDLGKLFFAICVLGIHTDAFMENRIIHSIIHSYIFAFTVPYFFICSGFFLGCKLKKIKDKKDYRITLLRYGRRLLIPYLIWGIWYFFVEIAADHITEGVPLKAAAADRVINWLICSPGDGLWYIQTILILLLILLISDKKSYQTGLLFISLGLSIVPALFESNADGLFKRILSSHTFLWDGFFFLSGIALAEFQEKRVTKRNGIIALSMGLLLTLVSSILSVTYFSRLIKLVTAVGLFSLAFNTSPAYTEEKSLLFRRWSTIIFFTHYTLKYGVQMVFRVMNLPKSTFIFIISVFLVMIYAAVVDRYTRNTKLYKILYSG